MAKSSHRNCAQIRLVKPHGTKFPWFLRSEPIDHFALDLVRCCSFYLFFWVHSTVWDPIFNLVNMNFVSRPILTNDSGPFSSKKKWTSLLIVGDHGKMAPELGRNGAHPLMTVWKLTQLQKQLKKRSCSLSDAAIFKFFKIIKNSIWLHFAASFFVDVLY